MDGHRFSATMDRLLELEAPLLRFFAASSYADHDPADPDVADLVAGNPQELALPTFVDALQRWSVPQDRHWYAYKFNEIYAREAIASGLRERRGIAFDPHDVFITDGAFTGLNVSIRTVADPGDEVVFISPPWFFYEALIVAAGATPARVRCDRETWDLDVDAIEASLTDRTRAIIVNSPNNPTGRIYPRATLDRLANVLTSASERNGRPIYLISDEAYSRITFDDRTFESPTSAYPYSLLVYTYGKQLLTPGERVGYVALPPEMPDRSTMQDALMMAQLAIGGQGVAGAVLQRSIQELETIVVDLKALQARRDRLVEALSSFGYEVHVPDGTFYLLPTSPIEDDQAFVERLAREKIFVLPGHLVEMPGRFRISVTGNDDMVERAIAVFERAAHHPG